MKWAVVISINLEAGSYTSLLSTTDDVTHNQKELAIIRETEGIAVSLCFKTVRARADRGMGNGNFKDNAGKIRTSNIDGHDWDGNPIQKQHRLKMSKYVYFQ